jgi:hypothetical protein
MALEGQTPAHAAGLSPKGWKKLLIEAITRDATQGENHPVMQQNQISCAKD